MALSQWKEAILEGIFVEIEEGVVMEKNLERLENLVEILQKEGSKVPESVKEAYCQVAVECTARCLAYERDAKEAYTEAIRSIWLNRIMLLYDKVSCLVTPDLSNGCRRLWTAHNNEKACKSLMDENTTEKALVSLRKVVSQLHPNLGDRNENIEESEEIECSEETGKTESMVETREIQVSHPYLDDRNENMEESEEIESSEETEKTESMVEDKESLSDTHLERPTSGGSKAEYLPRTVTTIPSAVVDRVRRKLRASKVDLVNALEGGGPSNLNNETSTEQDNDVADLSKTNTAPRRSLMVRRSTVHTYEWKDSIDDSDGEVGDDAEGNSKSKRKKVVVSHLKRTRIPEGDRKGKIPWCTAETLAVLKGYEKYGPDWKRIKEECPILHCRTNIDIKDKFRNEKRREERGR